VAIHSGRVRQNRKETIMRSALLLAVIVSIFPAQVVRAEESFIEATATFKGGVTKNYKCSPAGPNDNKYQPTAATAAMLKEFSFNLNCIEAASKSYFGMSFKVNRAGPGKAAVPADLIPFPDGSAAPRGKAAVWERLSNAFSVRAVLDGTPRKEMSLHSFPQLPQHYTEAKAKITDFRQERDAADGKFYNYVSGEGSAKFVEKFIDSKLTGEEGTLTWKFQNVKALHSGPQ